MANYKLTRYFRYTLVTLFVVVITSCSSTSEHKEVSDADYGSFPQDYQETVRSFLSEITAKQSIDPLSTQFLNTPDKFTYEQFGRPDEFGYRVCALIKTADRRKTKSHFFLINKGEVTQHLQDLGLVSLSSNYCDVEALTAVQPQNSTEDVEDMSQDKNAVDKTGIKYIVCDVDGDDKFFAFNSKSQQLQEEKDGRIISELPISESTDTFIVAEDETIRVSINRISGALVYFNEGTEIKGSCELTRRQKF